MRLRYFDVLKGVAIFMVVMGHVITMCIREIDRSVVFKFIGEIHMPLFFFISGWFTYRMLPDGKLKKPDLKKRAIQLLVPMVVVSTLWIYYFPLTGLQSPLQSTFEGLWINNYKNGYWFTLCLFEIIVLYAMIRPILTKTKSFGGGLAVTLSVWVVLSILAVIFLERNISRVIGLILVSMYWPAFMIGFLASRHRDGFHKMVVSPVWNTVFLLIGAFLLYYICWWWEFPGKELFETNEGNLIIARPLFHICLAFVAIAIFKPMVDKATKDGRSPRWVNLWSYLGANSLGIYLIHYFFLFPLTFMQEPMRMLNLGFVPTLFVAAISSAAIITVVVGVIRLLSISPFLSEIFTGKKE